MQFWWKWIDDLMGKGLDWSIIAELMLYASVNIVPMSLPLAILLSSIMTFGNLGESSEIVAMKSSGLSLTRIMSPLIVFMLCISIFAFYFSNYLWPTANLNMRILISDISDQKPTMNIKENIFYNDIEGYSIRVREKDVDENIIEDVLIYDLTSVNKNFQKKIWAERGRMDRTDDEKYLVLTLYNGHAYEEVDPKTAKGSYKPFQKSDFKETVVKMDLSTFELSRTDKDVYKNMLQMFNLKQLSEMQDSLERKVVETKERYRDNMKRDYFVMRDTLKNRYDSLQHKSTYSLASLPDTESKKAYRKAVRELKKKKTNLQGEHNSGYVSDLNNKNKQIVRVKIEWHRKIVLSFACLVLFFVGAPLGAIAKKGGIGVPVVASVLLFLLFYILSISGEKMANSTAISPMIGMWMSTIILAPVAAFLTYKAATDSILFDKETYLRLLRLKKKPTE